MSSFKYPFAIYCKSYRRDFLRLKRLLASIEKFNVDQLPVYVSSPQEDFDLFKEINGNFQFVTWVSDEKTIESNPRVPKGIQIGKEGYVVQAMVRPEFWRLGFAENYLCIDSDSLFIRDFHLSDFMGEDGVPYTIFHQNKELLQAAMNLGKDRVVKDFLQETGSIKAIFGRNGPDYSYVPSPFIWSAKVWQSLDEQFLQPQGKTIWDIVSRDLEEYLWYGEALLKYQAIPLRPLEPLFRVYHYDWQYYQLKRQGETPEKLKKMYLGIIYQSAWESEMDFGAPTKSFPSRILKQAKRRLRQLQSYF
jgi:hypothetical protein